MADKIVKTMAPVMCPHCNQEVIVSFRTMAPSIDWAMKSESIKEVKENLIKKVEKIEFKDAQQKADVVGWLRDDNVALGPDEADMVLEQVKADYEKK